MIIGDGSQYPIPRREREKSEAASIRFNPPWMGPGLSGAATRASGGNKKRKKIGLRKGLEVSTQARKAQARLANRTEQNRRRKETRGGGRYALRCPERHKNDIYRKTSLFVCDVMCARMFSESLGNRNRNRFQLRRGGEGRHATKLSGPYDATRELRKER